MKRKTRRIVLLGTLALILIGALSFLWVLADAIHTIEYIYNVDAALPALQWDGGVVRSTSPDMTVTVCDIIYRDGEGELAVEQNIPLPEEGYPCSLDIVRVLPVTTEYVRDAGTAEEQTVIVNYKNEYIYSFKDLEIANAARAYNSVFAYFTEDEQSKTNVSRILCLMRDLTVEEDFTILFPCSVELLTSDLTLNADLSLTHSYAGVYYVRTDGGNLTPENRFKLNAPNATYCCDDSLQIANALTYDAALEQALTYACELIPAYPSGNLLLQSAYQNYGISLSYSIDGNPFDGNISSLRGQEKQLTVTARLGEQTRQATLTLRFVDLENGTYVCEALTDATLRYCDEQKVQKSTVSSFDLATVIRDLFAGSVPDGKTLTVFLTDDSDLPPEDENATSFRQTGSDSLTRVAVSGDLSALSLYVRKGSVNIAEHMSLYFVYGEEAETCPATPSVTLDLEKATPDEILYYLKNLTPTFVTNKAYGVLNVQTSGIYAGAGDVNLLTGSTLGIESITGEFTGYNRMDHTDMTDAQIKNEYFGPMSEVYTYTLKSKMIMINPYHDVFFRYTVTFTDGTVKTFEIPVFRAALGVGGESEMFTSDNQLAAFFINEGMNWLAPEMLQLTSEYYTRIELYEINDIPVGSISADDTLLSLLQFVGDTSTKVTDAGWGFTEADFYQRYRLLVNPNYVPASNTTVTVHCYLFDSNTENDQKISEFYYEFVVPGILKCSGNGYADNWDHTKPITPYTFTDDAFYSLVVGMLGEDYTSEVLSSPDGSATENVVLSTAIYFEGNRMIDLDPTVSNGRGNAGYCDGDQYTALDFSGGSVSSIRNVDGIQVFERIQAVILDGVTVTGDIYAFADYQGLTLKYISMKGCSLTDGMIYRNGKSTLSNLYIRAINLADNRLTTVDGLLIRTVQVLDLSENQLTDIDPLYDLRDLSWLDVSGNRIRRFEILKQFDHLRTVFVTDNHATDPVYGSKGEINIPVYVWIMKTNDVFVYADAGAGYVACGNGRIYGYALTEDRITGSVVLNAFATHTVLNTEQKNKLETELKQIPGYTVRFVTYGGTEQNSISLYTDSGTTVNDSDPFGSGVVCYYRVSLYRGSTYLAQREFCVTRKAS